MHGKKPVSKTSKPKRPANGKGAARRGEVRKAVTAGHRPAAVAKPASKASAGAHSERTTHADRSAHAERPAHPERTASHAGNSAHGVNNQSTLERIRPTADTA